MRCEVISCDGICGKCKSQEMDGGMYVGLISGIWDNGDDIAGYGTAWHGMEGMWNTKLG
jgi:hypothetical protein